MKCQNCGNDVMGLNQRCPVCGELLYSNSNERQKNREINTTKTSNLEVKSNANSSKTVLLAIIAILVLISCVGLGIYFFTEENIFTGAVYILSGVISFAFIKGFTDIIDLLDNINKKINNNK